MTGCAHDRVYLGEMRLSAYARDLRGPAKVHYEQKVHLCGGIDPFDFSSDEAVCDMKCYPRIEFTDFKDYLVDGTSFTTRGELKAYKSMDVHNYVTSGWIQQPRVRDLGDGRRVVVGNVSGAYASHSPRSARTNYFCRRGSVAS